MPPFPTLTAGTVDELFNLSKGHPVFRVTMVNGQQFVIKADSRGSMGSGAGGFAKFDATLMSNVSKNTEIELLTRLELAHLRQCVSKVKPATEIGPFQANVMGDANFWYKMPELALKTAQGMFDKGEGEFLRKTFKNEKNLVKLGKIAAVDIFIGNKDRFDEEGNVANLGNIFFAKKRGLTGSSFTPIGLDFWDGFKEDMNMTLTASRWELLKQAQGVATGSHMESEFKKRMRILIDPGLMKSFATKTVETLNQDLIRNNVTAIDTSKVKYATAMASGIAEGSASIQKYLKAQVAKGGMGAIPPGALYRAQLLKWF